MTGEHRRRVKEIYTSAFEKRDRMPFAMMSLMSCLPSTDLLCFCDGETVCGFVYTASLGNVSFIMFFAVDEALRSKGYGGRILDIMQARRPGNKIIVTIERCLPDAPDLEQRQRRRAFYLRCGYAPTGYLIKLGNATQEVLIKNGEFNKREFAWFFLRYSNFTMLPRIWREDEA